MRQVAAARSRGHNLTANRTWAHRRLCVGEHQGTNTVNTSPSTGRRTAFGVWPWVCGLLLAFACSAPASSQGKKPDLYDLDANLVLLSPKVKPIYLKALGHDDQAAEDRWGAALADVSTLLRGRAFATS